MGILRVRNNFSLNSSENVENLTFSDFENKFYNQIALKTYDETIKKIDEFFNK